MAGGHPPKNDMQQAEQTFGCLDESVVFEYVAGEVFEKQNCAIYFGASWCPDCTSTTHKVGELLGPELGAGGGISLLYVSSDRTEESRQEYARKLLSSVEQVGGNKKKSGAFFPPSYERHHSSSEQSKFFRKATTLCVLKQEDVAKDLKYQFGACAGSEVAALPGIERRYGLPSLFLVKAGKVVKEFFN